MVTKGLQLADLVGMTGYKMSPTQFQQAGETRSLCTPWQYADTPKV